MDIKLAIVIPTKDRPRELKRLLESISCQDIKPIQVVVVDAGDTPAEDSTKKFSKLNIDYVRLRPPSLTVQRNIGIRNVKDEAQLVAFLDDDVVLQDSAIKNMLQFWKNAPTSVGAAGFNNICERFKRPSFMQRLFLVNAEEPGRILASGFQSRPCPIDEDTGVEWLPGFAMVFRKNIFDEFMPDEWFSGYARYEDVDFSYRVGKKYKLFVVKDARVKHLNSLENPDFSFALGKMEIINRLYFVRKNSELSQGLFLWASFGLFLNNITKGIFRIDKRYILRSQGNMAGFMEIFKKENTYVR